MQTESFDLEVVDVVDETADARSFTFRVPAGAEEQFRFRPGQFLTVAVPSDRTGVAARCYSLCSSPHDLGPTGDQITIAVKRTPSGYASNWLNDHLAVGSTLRVLPPSGIFTPVSLDADLLLFAGGSGVTPILSIVRETLSHGTGRVVVLYANRDERSVMFAGELRDLAAAYPGRLQVVHWLESLQGLPSAEQLRAFASERASYDAFVCGPAPFLKATVGVLRELGFPRERRHQEKFISLGGNPFGDAVEAAEAAAEVAAADDAGPAGPGRGTTPTGSAAVARPLV